MVIEYPYQRKHELPQSQTAGILTGLSERGLSDEVNYCDFRFCNASNEYFNRMAVNFGPYLVGTFIDMDTGEIMGENALHVPPYIWMERHDPKIGGPSIYCVWLRPFSGAGPIDIYSEGRLRGSTDFWDVLITGIKKKLEDLGPDWDPKKPMIHYRQGA